MSFERPHTPSHPPRPATAWTVRRKPASPAMPAPAMPPLTQRYQASWLTRRGTIEDLVRMGPQVPLFAQSFGALAHGALVPTLSGPVAVEDLVPGTPVVTAQGVETLLWVGSQTLVPGGRRRPLYRIPAEALGPGRPCPDLVLGPAARIVSRRAGLRASIGTDAALVPIEALTDGMTVIEVWPASAVQVFHLGFRAHRTLAVSGIEVESVHPGSLDPTLGPDLVALYLSLFPHLDRAEDFGRLLMPRLTGADAERHDAA